MYTIIYAREVAGKDIPRLSSPIRNLIRARIESKLLSDPIKFGKPLRHSLKGCRSFRVSDYRIIYQLIDTTIKILIIRHRKDCYKIDAEL